MPATLEAHPIWCNAFRRMAARTRENGTIGGHADAAVTVRDARVDAIARPHRPAAEPAVVGCTRGAQNSPACARRVRPTTTGSAARLSLTRDRRRRDHPRMAYEQILYAQQNEIVLLTLNRPEKLNAWTPQMASELADAIGRANDE